MATRIYFSSQSVVILAGTTSCSLSFSSCPASIPAQTGPGLAWDFGNVGMCMGAAEQLWSPDVFWLYGRLACAGVDDYHG